MRGRSRQSTPAAPPDALLLQALNRALGAGNATPFRDPTLQIVATQDGRTGQTGGELTNLTPEVLGNWLREFYQGRFGNIAPLWETMESRSDMGGAAREKRLEKVLAEVQNWEIIPLDDSPEAERHAEFLRGLYNRLRAVDVLDPIARGGVAKAAEFALDAIGKKYSFQAKVWERRGGRLQLTLKRVPLWHIERWQGEYRLLQRAGTYGSGQPIDYQQWVIGARRRAVMEPVCVAVLLGRLPLHQMVHVLEKWGVVSAYGRTNASKDSPSWQALWEAVDNIRNGFAAVIGGDASLETIEPKGGSGQLALPHLKALEMFDRSIIISWLGGSLSTQAQGDTGSLAGGAQSEDLDDKIAGDLVWLSELYQEQIDRQAIELEFGAGTEPLAYWQAKKADAEDDDSTRKSVQLGVNSGVAIGATWYRQRFNIPDPEAGEETLINTVNQNLANRPAAEAAANRALTAAGNARPRPGITQADRDLRALEAALLPRLRTAHAQLVQPLFTAVESLGNLAAAQQYLESAEARRALDTTALAQLLQETTAAAAMRGLVPVRPEIAAGNRSLLRRWGTRLGLIAAGNAAVVPEPLPFDEAEQFWRSQPLVVPDPQLVFTEIWGESEARGVRVAGITSESTLAEIQRDLLRLIEGGEAGLTLQQWVQQAQAKYGFSASRAETIARTNVQTAYQWGHYQQLTDPAVAAAYPVWGWDVTVDANTTDEICLPLAGQARAASDPLWDTLYPPNHFNCRTTVFPLGADEAAEYGFTLGEGWPRFPGTSTRPAAQAMPLEGFRRNVGKQPLGEI